MWRRLAQYLAQAHSLNSEGLQSWLLSAKLDGLIVKKPWLPVLPTDAGFQPHCLCGQAGWLVQVR